MSEFQDHYSFDDSMTPTQNALAYCRHLLYGVVGAAVYGKNHRLIALSAQGDVCNIQP